MNNCKRSHNTLFWVNFHLTYISFHYSYSANDTQVLVLLSTHFFQSINSQVIHLEGISGLMVADFFQLHKKKNESCGCLSLSDSSQTDSEKLIQRDYSTNSLSRVEVYCNSLFVGLQTRQTTDYNSSRTNLLRFKPKRSNLITPLPLMVTCCFLE